MKHKIARFKQYIADNMVDLIIWPPISAKKSCSITIFRCLKVAIKLILMIKRRYVSEKNHYHHNIKIPLLILFNLK